MKRGHDSEIVRLHQEGRSFREIGHSIGISHVAVRKRYLKALKVTNDLGQPPEKGSPANQLSATAENVGSRGNPEVCGNLRKPEIPNEAKTTQVNKGSLPGDIPPHHDLNPSGNQGEDRFSSLVCAKDNLAKLSHCTENTKAPAEPKYYRHIPTGRLFHRNEAIDEEIRSEFQPYFPPKYLKKTSEPNRGEIFIWTFILAQRLDMEPYFGELPREKKPEERQPEIKGTIPFTNTVKESARTEPDLQFPDQTGKSEGSQPESHRDVNPKSKGRECSEMLRSRRKHDHLESDVNPTIDDRIIEMRGQGRSLSFIGKVLGISKVAVHKRLTRIAVRQEEKC